MPENLFLKSEVGNLDGVVQIGDVLNLYYYVHLFFVYAGGVLI